MTDEQAKANMALAGLSGSYITATDRAAIVSRFGEATARTVAEVYDEAMNPPDDWGSAADSMGVGLDAMHARLRERYPWLDDAARQRLNGMFMMTWK